MKKSTPFTDTVTGNRLVTLSRNNTADCKSFVVMLDCLKHDTVAVCLLQENLIAYLQQQEGTYRRYRTLLQLYGIWTIWNLVNCHEVATQRRGLQDHSKITSHWTEPCDGIAETGNPRQETVSSVVWRATSICISGQNASLMKLHFTIHRQMRGIKMRYTSNSIPHTVTGIVSA
jgi:hypothetical protein